MTPRRIRYLWYGTRFCFFFLSLLVSVAFTWVLAWVDWFSSFCFFFNGSDEWQSLFYWLSSVPSLPAEEANQTQQPDVKAVTNLLLFTYSTSCMLYRFVPRCLFIHPSFSKIKFKKIINGLNHTFPSHFKPSIAF